MTYSFLMMWLSTEQLDWFFTSVDWTLSFLDTLVLPMAKISSDHIPCKVSIGTSIPKTNIFRFENYWPEHPGFIEVVQGAWDKPTHKQDIAAIISAKLKGLRYDLKHWSKRISNLTVLIDKCNKVIFYMDCLEDCRTLADPEWNFWIVIKKHPITLLKYKKIY